jgi:RND family efflux transporter MFP subunit
MNIPKHLLVALGLAAAVAAGCKPHGESKASGAAALPAVAVQVQTVEAKQHPATEETVGTVRTRLQARLEAKIPGRIDRMQAETGQTVKAGELLVHLDAQEIRAKLDQALAVEQQAESDLKRYQKLLETSSATQAEFDAMQARALVAVGAVKEAQAMLGYADVVAPFDGVVTRKLADLGDLAVPGKPLLDLEDPAHLRFETDIPEAIIERVAIGATMPVRVPNAAGDLQGTVSEIAPTADPNTRTFRVKLDLPSAPGLRAGQFGRVAVPLAETSALRVAASAVVRRGQMELVFVVVNGHAQLRLVKTGKRIGDEVELVSGVDAGEQVVRDNAGQLVDGQPVTVQP